jgi:hypothetical protein
LALRGKSDFFFNGKNNLQLIRIRIRYPLLHALFQLFDIVKSSFIVEKSLFDQLIDSGKKTVEKSD